MAPSSNASTSPPRSYTPNGIAKSPPKGPPPRAPVPLDSKTFRGQSKLPKLPVPPLEETCQRYLRALEGLQDEEEHAATKAAVEEFLSEHDEATGKGGEGKKLQSQLLDWAKTHDSYIEDFWYESYLSHSESVVLSLNPFFVLENDPNPTRGAQLPRAASLIIASLGFIHDLREGILEPDNIRGKIPLDMDQYTRLFGTARIPTERGCKMQVNSESRHIVVLRRGQFYWFPVLDMDNKPLLTEREVIRNLQAIVHDADGLKPAEAAYQSIGVLTTENRKTWSKLRTVLKTTTQNNRSSLQLVDSALFVVCLDDWAEEEEFAKSYPSHSCSPNDNQRKDGSNSESRKLAEICANFLCGTYDLDGGVQVGTCMNRWYDKLQIIVTGSGSAGINFEHSGVDGHTVLRFAADVYTQGLMLLAKSINPSAPTLFKAELSPLAKSAKGRRLSTTSPSRNQHVDLDTTPKKLLWDLTPEIRVGIRFAETRLSDLICQNDCQALEFSGYGKNFITSHGFSPDAFVQMAFQAAYFGLYGRIECTYEPAMTKAYLHGRTEAIRTVQKESVDFTKLYYSEATASQKVDALRKACERHVKLTKDCSQGFGQDRHLYALYCLLRRDPSASMPRIFTDPGWALLNASVLSTSNCGNPALRLFGFGPVVADGYGIGYIIKEDGLSVCAASKHLQTRRFLQTLETYLRDMQKLLVHLHRSANERPAPFVDHTGVLRDSKTGRPINGWGEPAKDSDSDEDEMLIPGYSFFDSGDVALLGQRRRTPWADVGKVLHIAEY
ncbi:acyltransferase ChoActase/COT/CPT [Schizophyllum amplum]|uniref:Acyltransferase ChoActase/COT/CPT n=1 Tax=Schizophyllum amplum TaxID=97359 RepID=A0A550BX99_9AGAR|nr:acyltransferase ChoActase/COT/CPT [Auriculariopsis ampla]